MSCRHFWLFGHKPSPVQIPKYMHRNEKKIKNKMKKHGSTSGYSASPVQIIKKTYKFLILKKIH